VHVSPGLCDLISLLPSAPYLQTFEQAMHDEHVFSIRILNGDILPASVAIRPTGQYDVQCIMIPRFADIIFMIIKPVRPKQMAADAAAISDTENILNRYAVKTIIARIRIRIKIFLAGIEPHIRVRLAATLSQAPK